MIIKWKLEVPIKKDLSHLPNICSHFTHHNDETENSAFSLFIYLFIIIIITLKVAKW